MSMFTPVTGLLGGSLIGASAASLLLINGDIMGFSGIFSSAFLHPVKTARQNPWKFVFLASFFSASSLYAKLVPECMSQPGSVPSTLAHVVSGLLVGFGTSLGNGCTSGHGICGLARFSKRSIVAVGTFMATGILTTLLLPEALFRTNQAPEISPWNGIYLAMATVGVALLVLHTVEANNKISTNNKSPHVKSLGAILSAGFAAVGLGISGMVQFTKIGNFLNLSLLAQRSSSSSYDPTLLTVMGSAVVFSWIGYQFLPKYTIVCSKDKCMTKPLNDDTFHVPTTTHIDWRLVGGAATFGVGWGLGTMCPGPAFFHVAAGAKDAMFLWFPTYLAGAFLAERLVHHLHQSHHSKSKLV